MAAPTYSTATAGQTDAGGVWTCSGTTFGALAVGDVIILQILQDGSTLSAVALTGSANINDLAGAAGWTLISASRNVGNPIVAYQYIYIGRATSAASGPEASGTNSTSEDLYMRMYAFKDVSTGTTLGTVIENATAGAAVNVNGTSATAADASVQTLGPDRLALNLVAANDDVTIAAFTGQSGGTWVEAVAEYADPAGTDGAIQLQTAAMASAGTIDGGTAALSLSAGWGAFGFALIGTTVADQRRPSLVNVNQAVARASSWFKRLDGILVPERRIWVPRPS